MIVFLVLCILSGILNRLGGSANGNRLFRLIGVPLIMTIAIVWLGLVHNIKDFLCLVLSQGLEVAAISTYRYFFKKPVDYGFWFYAMHGFVVSLALLPFAWASHHLIAGLVRAVICGILVGGWSWAVSIAIIEEFGRGLIFNATLIILRYIKI